MRILIHAVGLKKEGGSSRHLEEFAAALNQLRPSHEYIFCLDERFAREFQGLCPPGEIVTIKTPSDWHRLWWDSVTLNHVVQEKRIDVILALLTFGSVRPAVPQINFQRTPSYFCDYYLKTLKGPRLWKIIVRRWWLKQVMKASRVIVTPTAAMRDMILQFYPSLPMGHFRIIPHGFNKQRFLQVIQEAQNHRSPCTNSNDVIRVLYVSHFLPYKGFHMIPRVAKILCDEGIKAEFTITGGRDDWPEGYDYLIRESKALGVDQSIRLVGRIPLEEAYCLYPKADIFFFPSLCESFGFPMVEAMGAGLPIVAVNTPVNREICGDAAVYFEPGDSFSAAQQIARLRNKHERESITKIGTDRFERWVLDMAEYAWRVLRLIEEAGRA